MDKQSFVDLMQWGAIFGLCVVNFCQHKVNASVRQCIATQIKINDILKG